MATRGVTQGDIISPVLFNIAVDAVIRKWERMMAQYGDFAPIADCTFYADDGRIGSLDPTWVQRSLNTFVDLFKRLGLHMNAAKTKSMVTKGFVGTIKQSDEAYLRRTQGVGLTHREREVEVVTCGICHQTMQRKLLRGHMELKHPDAAARMVEETSQLEDEVEGVFACNMESRARANCPICNTSISTRYGMRNHFVSRHPLAAVRFPGDPPPCKCPNCGTMVTNLGTHQGSKQCVYAKMRQEKRKMKEENLKAVERVFKIGDQPVERVSYFKYLGRILTQDDRDWTAIAANIRKARQRWGMVARILSREGATTKTMGYFYKSIVQSVLLYGSETWVVTEQARKSLNTFHHRCARYISGHHIKKNPDDTWEYPRSEEVLEECGLYSMGEYINRRMDTIKEFAKRRPIFAMCKSSTPAAGNSKQKTWWESAGRLAA